MPRKTNDPFSNATQIAEMRIRDARAEQSAFFLGMCRAAARALFSSARRNGVTARVPAHRKA